MANSSSRDTGRSVSPRLVLAGLLALLILVFIVENTKRVDIRFIVPEVEAPLWVALLASAVGGFLAGWLFALLRRER